MIQQPFLTSEECDTLINMAGEFEPSYVTSDGVHKRLSKKRKSEEVPFSGELLNSMFGDRLSTLGIKSFGDTKIIKYQQGSYFVPHRDRGDGLKHRQKSVVIQLSESSDYTGGNLLVENQRTIRTKGTLIMFDSGKIHEVTELSSGVRYTLISWLEDKHLNEIKTVI